MNGRGKPLPYDCLNLSLQSELTIYTLTIPCYNIPIPPKEVHPMKTTTQRILAVIGLVLIAASIVLMIAGMFMGAAKALALNISLFCFLGAVTVLLVVSYQRKRQETEKSPDEE